MVCGTSAPLCSRTLRCGTNWSSSSAPCGVHGSEPPTACLGPAVPRVGRLDGCHLGRPTRNGDPVAADRLPALLGLEELPERAGPSGRRVGGPSAHPTNVSREPPVGRAADSRELQKLGLEISQAAVSKYLGRRSTPPSQTWRTFLNNHTVLCKVLFVFVVLAHERRRVVHINVTDAPTAQWTAQQLVEAFPWQTAPRYLLRDRDAVYGVAFSSRVQTMGIHEVKTAPRSPWQNPYVERLIGTLRRECLDHVVVLNEPHLRRLLRGYLIYYPGPAPTSP